MKTTRQMLKELITRLDKMDSQNRVNKKKAAELDEIKKLLSKVQVRVVKCAPTLGENGSFGVLVTYELPQAFIEFDGDKEGTNEQVRALNLLGVVSQKDMIAIADTIEAVRRINDER